MTTFTRPGKIALLGYSIETMEAAQALGYDFVVVVPPGFEEGLQKEGINAISWEFDKLSQDSTHLREQLVESRAHALVVGLGVPTARDPALVGDDHEVEAGLLEGAQRVADTRQQLHARRVTQVARIADQGPVAVEEHGTGRAGGHGRGVYAVIRPATCRGRRAVGTTGPCSDRIAPFPG